MSLFFYIYLEITLFGMIAGGSDLNNDASDWVRFNCPIVPDPYWGFDQLWYRRSLRMFFQTQNYNLSHILIAHYFVC